MDSIVSSDQKQLAREFLDLEELHSREARSRAVVLEILGDIPDADVAPPKNVLFVCKLNPVTEADDLKLIFSRFGPVVSCDVIRDYKTGDSLQYAFVEFESEDSCNDAYFRMQNVLIDDRRIHVDFCQSVSGFWKRFKDNQRFSRISKMAGSTSHRKSPTRPISRDIPGDRTVDRSTSGSPGRHQRSRSTSEELKRTRYHRDRYRRVSPDRRRSRRERSFSISPDRKRTRYRHRSSSFDPSPRGRRSGRYRSRSRSKSPGRKRSRHRHDRRS
ncbi:RNA recognition motif domain containing protein [Babesia bovis T2Bo]|uniref:peptidylprolyl isomerase n=1 Tax=Babesia bovis TaxID=5865 RepID=A7AMW9_BABBO|nr:RNA recognition motif domain containing protein [Babesia bovis T2Bo]EDO07903.1 RNA recognition motif domain containing protein [Babesia bovis T2Bo]|eukprot:XP_001611471.1 RNA recognition motif domain containing protein [Babesia bovis T2Bo]